MKQQEWTSAAGSKIIASAEKIEDSKVTFKRGNGKTLLVPLDQLSPTDQARILKHFSKEIASPEREKAQNLPHPKGKVVGPIQADGAKYFLYLPTTLIQDRPAPLMFFTGAGGAKEKHVARYIEGAEVNGWIIAASVESRNSRNNKPFVKACIEHIKETLPVDPERFYFTGGSGGAVLALVNCQQYDGAGAMPFIAHGVIDKFPSKKSHYYFVNGATDYNRSASASMRVDYKDHAFQRFHSGGHFNGPNSIANDGIAWLNGKYLAEKIDDPQFKQERFDYEKAMLNWARQLNKKAPHRALLQLDFLTREYEISGPHAKEVEQMKTELSQTSSNELYVEAIFAIDEFSQKELSKFGKSSRHKHTNAGIKKAAAALKEKYEGVPEIPEILEKIQKPTI